MLQQSVSACCAFGKNAPRVERLMVWNVPPSISQDFRKCSRPSETDQSFTSYDPLRAGAAAPPAPQSQHAGGTAVDIM